VTDTFTWDHVSEPTGAITFAVLTAQFGDGYSQAMPDGLNNKSGSWPLTFFGQTADMKPIMDFLDSHQGATSFFWTPPLPGATQGLYRCPGYQPLPYGDDWYQITATFQQVFAP